MIFRKARPPGPASLEPLCRELEGLPQQPLAHHHPKQWMWRARRLGDFVGHARPTWARILRRINPYPSPFRHVRFKTHDGVTIAAWHGPAHPGTRPTWGIVLVPGLFSTKDDSAHKARALRLWRSWKVPVITLDLRAFGESTGVATAGWKEAYDVHAAAEYLARREGIKSVGVIAESMGGAAALNALAYDAQTGQDLLDGVLCFSAFADAKDAVAYISQRPPAGHPFLLAWSAFTKLLRISSGYDRFDEYLDDVARVNGLGGLDELLDLANPKWKVGLMQKPVLLVHATDDPVVPVRHARRMERYARDRPHIQTLVTDWGGHTGFETMDPEWFWEVCGRFFGHVFTTKLPNPYTPETP